MELFELFNIFRKRDKNNADKSIKANQELSEYVELIQAGVNCILESRKSHCLKSSVIHQIAFYVMYTRLLQKIELITSREKILILSIYSLHCENETDTDCSDIISRFESIYEKCFCGDDFATAVQLYAFSVEMEYNEHSSDYDMSCSIDCVVDNVSFFLKALQ